MTGVNPITLRAWERRYGLIKPERTAKGHRLYTDQDIQQILNITDSLQQGMSISQVANAVKSKKSPAQFDSPWTVFQERMFHAVIGFNSKELEQVYNEVLSLYPNDIVVRMLFKPLLIKLGERWQQMEGGVAEEHFFGSYLRNKLGAWFHHQNQNAHGTQIVAACFPGEQHEIGLLFFCQQLVSHGFQVIYLGPDLPISELKVVIQRTHVRVIVLSASAMTLTLETIKSLRDLVNDKSLSVFVGGEISVMNFDQLDSIGIKCLGTDLKHGLDNMLSQIM